MDWKVDSGAFDEGVEPDPLCKAIDGREGLDVVSWKVDATGTFVGEMVPVCKVDGREKPRVVGWKVGATGRFVEEMELDPLCKANGCETVFGVLS